MTKELFITAGPNNLSTFENLMNKGKQLVESNEIKDFICQINWKQDCVKLYVIK